MSYSWISLTNPSTLSPGGRSSCRTNNPGIGNPLFTRSSASSRMVLLSCVTTTLPFRSPLEDDRVRCLREADIPDVQEIHVRDMLPELGNDSRVDVFVSE